MKGWDQRILMIDWAVTRKDPIRPPIPCLVPFLSPSRFQLHNAIPHESSSRTRVVMKYTVDEKHWFFSRCERGILLFLDLTSLPAQGSSNPLPAGQSIIVLKRAPQTTGPFVKASLVIRVDMTQGRYSQCWFKFRLKSHFTWPSLFNVSKASTMRFLRQDKMESTWNATFVCFTLLKI